MFKEEIKKLQERMYSQLLDLIENKGTTSDNTSNKVLNLEMYSDDLCFNLEGGRYLVELDANRLYDNNGYQYDHEVLTFEQMAEILDYVSNVEVYFQPELPAEMWGTEEGIYSFQVYHTKERCLEDFPDYPVERYSGDDIEEKEYIE